MLWREGCDIDVPVVNTTCLCECRVTAFGALTEVDAHEFCKRYKVVIRMDITVFLRV